MSRREPLISTRPVDLLVFPTDEAASCGTFGTHDLAVIRCRAELQPSKQRTVETTFAALPGPVPAFWGQGVKECKTGAHYSISTS
jgi:hypothetical protein